MINRYNVDFKEMVESEDGDYVLYEDYEKLQREKICNNKEDQEKYLMQKIKELSRENMIMRKNVEILQEEKDKERSETTLCCKCKYRNKNCDEMPCLECASVKEGVDGENVFVKRNFEPIKI
jgi:hypothetical protein